MIAPGAEFYHPGNCLYQEFGKGQWNGTGHRIVSTMFDLDNAPQSNLVMGEVFNQPGRWSSYPPHHHPQPEVYYYQFDHPEGFGAGLRATPLIKHKTVTACAFGAATPPAGHRSRVRNVLCMADPALRRRPVGQNQNLCAGI